MENYLITQGLSDKDIDKIADAVVRRLGKQLKVPQELVSMNGIESMLGYAKNSSAARKLTKEPDFPAPLPLSENNRPRWLKKDVQDWIESRKKNQY